MAQGWLQIAIFFAALLACVPLLGGYMARVYTGERVALERVLGPVERGIYRLIGVDPGRDQDWKAYAKSLIWVSFIFWLALYLILRTQTLHPFNPQGFHSAPWDVTFNTDLVVPHQHELAVLRRRDDDDQLQPDGGAWRSRTSSPPRSASSSSSR